MHSKTLKRYLAYSLLLAVLALPAASAKPQQRKALPNDQLPIKIDCPEPIALTLTATNPTSFDPADFSLAQLNGPPQHATGLGDQSSDRGFLYTFHWKKDERCCQITNALLTIKMKSLQGSQSLTSPDSGNDNITIMYLKLPVSPYDERVYKPQPPPPPFGPGTITIKTWNLNQTELNYINASGRLSFYVQDDTSVESATLQLWGCCLTAKTPEATGYATQKECEAHEKQACSLQYGAWHRTN